jgi:formate dehydrogenase subunit delta
MVSKASPEAEAGSHGHKPPEAKLVHMANQIGKFFASQKDLAPPEGVLAHIRKFWDPRMRAMILAHLDRGGEGLDPVAREAIELLKKQETGAR